VADDYPDTRLVMPLRHEHTAKLEPAQRAFWEELMGWMLGPRFGQLMIAKFALYLQHRFNDLRAQRFGDEALVVRDRTHVFAAAAHRCPGQGAVLPFLPAAGRVDGAARHLALRTEGPGFTCQGGMRHPFRALPRVHTMEYLPNTLFAFMKTNDSFHGVEPITQPDVQRDLLLTTSGDQQQQELPSRRAPPFQNQVLVLRTTQWKNASSAARRSKSP
jgi:hypothetical protein